LFFFLNS